MKAKNIVLTSHSLSHAVTCAKDLTTKTGNQHYTDSYELTKNELNGSNPQTIQRHFVYEIINID